MGDIFGLLGQNREKLYYQHSCQGEFVAPHRAGGILPDREEVGGVC